MNQENTTPEEFEFREGDICEHVISGDQFLLTKMIGQDFYIRENSREAYDKNGKACLSDKYPSIRLIKRPKKQKKVEVVRWVNVFTTSTYDVIDSYLSEEEAKKYSNGSDAVAVAVEMRGHYFIEED